MNYYIDKNCEHFCAQFEQEGDTEPSIWCCNLMTGKQDHEGNCGQYDCPLGKKKPVAYWSGCNFYKNTGKKEFEPIGTATAMHGCGGCDKLETCELKKDTQVWKLGDK